EGIDGGEARPLRREAHLLGAFIGNRLRERQRKLERFLPPALGHGHERGDEADIGEAAHADILARAFRGTLSRPCVPSPCAIISSSAPQRACCRSLSCRASGSTRS